MNIIETKKNLNTIICNAAIKKENDIIYKEQKVNELNEDRQIRNKLDEELLKLKILLFLKKRKQTSKVISNIATKKKNNESLLLSIEELTSIINSKTKEVSNLETSMLITIDEITKLDEEIVVIIKLLARGLYLLEKIDKSPSSINQKLRDSINIFIEENKEYFNEVIMLTKSK